MAFKDLPMRCNACGHRFFNTVADQRKRAEMSMHDHAMLFCTRCKSADVIEADLAGFGPSPTAPVAPRKEEAQVDADEQIPIVDPARRESDHGQLSPGVQAESPVNRTSRRPERRPERKPESAPERTPDPKPEPAAERTPERRRDSRDGAQNDTAPRSSAERPRGRGGRGKGGGGRQGEQRRGGGRQGSTRHGGKRGGGRKGQRREPARQTELRVRHMGTVKWFDDDRGYGFIAQDEGGELFVHLTGLIVEGYDTLLEGTPVEYEIERTTRGPQAVDVVPLA